MPLLSCLLVGGLARRLRLLQRRRQGCSIPIRPARCTRDADALLNSGNYTEAAKKFEDLDRDHPYAPEARRAIVMAAYAYYKAGKYPGGHRLGASATRPCIPAPRTRRSPTTSSPRPTSTTSSDPARDQTATRKALAELKMLVQRYPDSPYAKQADNRIRIAEDTLAASEMNVGRYYQKRNNQVAAINRYKMVVTEYQTTAHVEEALYRLVETNMSLGIVPEAQTAAAVLGHNYPELGVVRERLRAAEVRRRQPADEPGHLDQQHPEGAHPGRRSRSRSPRRHRPPAPAGSAVARGHAGAARCRATCRSPARRPSRRWGLRRARSRQADVRQLAVWISLARGGSLARHEATTRPTSPSTS